MTDDKRVTEQPQEPPARDLQQEPTGDAGEKPAQPILVDPLEGW